MISHLNSQKKLKIDSNESSSFRKLARNKWISREICNFFSWSIYFISHQFNHPDYDHFIPLTYI